MKNTWKAALAAAAVLGSTQIAKADLTLDGQTGLVNNPTADVASRGAGEAQLTYQHKPESEYYYSANMYSISGAVSVADRLEVNGAALRSSTYDYIGGQKQRTHRTLLAIGAKYQIVKQNDFSAAIGARYKHINSNVDFLPDTNITSLYLAGTKAFSNDKRAPIKATLGLRWDKMNFGHYGSESKTSVYGGVQVPLTQSGDVSLIGELQSKNYDDPEAKIPYALGLRWSPAGKRFTLSAGINRDGILVNDKNAFFVQAGYRFGK